MLTIKVIHCTEPGTEVDKKLDRILAEQAAIRKQIDAVGVAILEAIGDPARIAELTRKLSDSTDKLQAAMNEVSSK